MLPSEDIDITSAAFSANCELLLRRPMDGRPKGRANASHEGVCSQGLDPEAYLGGAHPERRAATPRLP
jgi:hypothetical protein